MTTATGTDQNSPKTFLGRMFGTLKYDGAVFLQAVISVVQHDVFPFVEKLFSTIALDNLKVLKPLAEEALAEFEGELPVLLSQGMEGFLKVFNATVARLYTKATAAALNVTETDILTAAHAVVLNAKFALPTSAS